MKPSKNVRATAFLIVSLSMACLWSSCEREEKPEPFMTAIAGIVADATTGERIRRATVSVFDTVLTTLTDSNGIFTIKAVPAGTQRVIASKIGYGVSCLRVEAREDWFVNVGSILLPRLSPPKVIGPQGGTVTAGDGTSVYIPAGAVSVSTPISVTPILEGKGMPGPPSEGRIIIAAANFGPAGTTFHKPVTLTFPIPSSALAEFNLDLLEFDATALEWKNTGIEAVANADEITVSALVTHFSPYSIELEDVEFKIELTYENIRVLAKGDLPPVCDKWGLKGPLEISIKFEPPDCYKKLFKELPISNFNFDWRDGEWEVTFGDEELGKKFKVNWEVVLKEDEWRITFFKVKVRFAPPKVANPNGTIDDILPCSFSVKMTEKREDAKGKVIGKCHDQGVVLPGG